MQMKSLFVAIFALGMTTLAIADTNEIVDANGTLKLAPSTKNSANDFGMSSGVGSGDSLDGSQDLASQIQSLTPEMQRQIQSLPPEQQKAVLKSLKSAQSAVPGQAPGMQPLPTPQTITPPTKEPQPSSPAASTMNSAASELDRPSSDSSSSSRNSEPTSALSNPSSSADGEMMGQPGL